MVFLQPVVVNDAQAADQKTLAAEVRVIDRHALEQPVWTGPMLAQGAMDQRSPFGNNAPASNELTPRPRMVNPSDNNTQSGFTATGSGAGQVADPMSTTKIPPAAGQPDAGPPPPSAGTATTPGGTTAEPNPVGPAPNPTTTMPDTTPAQPTTGTTPGSGAGAAPPSIPDSRSIPAVPAQPGGAPPPSATLPGASSGASNTR
jgi:hypothetical protein